jgi:hypothetical protein
MVGMLIQNLNQFPLLFHGMAEVVVVLVVVVALHKQAGMGVLDGSTALTRVKVNNIITYIQIL